MSKYGPVDVFSNMLSNHLKSGGSILDINNFNLLKNLLMLSIREGVLAPATASKFADIEEMWGNINKGCGCTKNKRTDLAENSLKNFIESLEGKESFEKIKEHYEIKKLTINLLGISKEISP